MDSVPTMRGCLWPSKALGGDTVPRELCWQCHRGRVHHACPAASPAGERAVAGRSHHRERGRSACQSAPTPRAAAHRQSCVKQGPVSLARLYFELPVLIFPALWDVIKLVS